MRYIVFSQTRTMLGRKYRPSDYFIRYELLKHGFYGRRTIVGSYDFIICCWLLVPTIEEVLRLKAALRPSEAVRAHFLLPEMTP